MIKKKKNIYLCSAKKRRVLLVGQVTTLSLSKQGFESPTRYEKKTALRLSFFYTVSETPRHRDSK